MIKQLDELLRAYLARDPAARSRLEVLLLYPGVTAVVCRIETGRTHQIRVHMASLGCPVVGDAIYGKGTLDKTLDPVPPRQMLHAWRLSLWHPVKGEKMSFEAPIPADMAVYMADAPLQPRIDKQTGGNRP